MNDKLKQSLDTRLGGMRWGERDQAEVFRLCQRKETQDVKHVKRGSGMLAIAMALLFIVMGAAFALTNTTTAPQNENTLVAGQQTEPTFVPVLRRSEPTGELIGETDAVSIYLESSWYDGFSGTATLRVRANDPAIHLTTAPNEDGTASESNWVVQAEGNWNDYYRSYIIPAITREEATGDLIIQLTYDDPLPAGYKKFNMPVVLSIVNEKTWETERAELSIDLEIPEDYAWHPLYLVDSEASEALIQAGYIITDRYTYVGVMQTFDNHYPAFTLTDGEGNVLAAIDSSPGFNPAIETMMFPGVSVDAECVTTSIVRLEGTQPPPETMIATFHTQKGFFLLHFELSTVDPLTQRSEPTGELIGGTDAVSVYLEDSWYDGFSSTATLRVRADDPTDRVAFIPNEGDTPSIRTWVVQVSTTDYYADMLTTTMSQEGSDVLIHIDYYCEFHPGNTTLNLPLTVSVTNEKTWEREEALSSLPLRSSIAGVGRYPYQPLTLLSASQEDVFLQGGVITTDRYHYIGVMRTYSSYYPGVTMTDDQGNLLASTTSSFATTGEALLRNSYSLFPYIGEADLRVTCSVVRLDKSIPLPEVLHVQYVNQRNDGPEQPLLVLGTNIAPVVTPNTLLDTPLMTVTLLHADYLSDTATGMLQVTLKEPDKYTLNPNGTATGKTLLTLTPELVGVANTNNSICYTQAYKTLVQPTKDGGQILFVGDTPTAHPDAAPGIPWCNLTLAVSGADGAADAVYNASFRLTENEGITRWQVKTMGNTPDSFMLQRSDLVVTDYMAMMTIRWSGDATRITLSWAEFTALAPTQAGEVHTNVFFLEDFTVSNILYLHIFLPDRQGPQPVLLLTRPDD